MLQAVNGFGMPIATSSGRGGDFDLDVDEIRDAEIEGASPEDHPKYVDAQVVSGKYPDASEESGFRDLTDAELEYLTNNERDWLRRQVREQWY